MAFYAKAVLVFLFLVVVRQGSCNQGQAPSDTEDNEFAEFEDFDDSADTKPATFTDEEEEDDEDDFENPVDEPPGGSNEKVQDDEDDATIETEDDEFATLDPDEFEGLPGDDTIWENDKKSKKGKKKSEPELQIAKVPMHLRSWDKYMIEILMVAGLTVYLVNFFIGKTKNSHIASQWLKHNVEFLQNQFELVGDDPQNKSVESTLQLSKESEHNYSLWCSGRRCCEGMLVEIKLLKRQDLISIISYRMKPSNDQVVVTINMDDMDAFVFCIGTKKSVINLQKTLQDTTLFCTDRLKPAEKFGLSDDFFMLSELGEVPSAIMDAKVTKVLSDYSHFFESLHISDQYSGLKPSDQDDQPTKAPDTEKVIILTMNVPAKGDTSEMLPMLKMIVYLADKVRRLKLGREGKLRAEKHRKEVANSFLKLSHAQRQEAAQLKKEEKEKALKERMMSEEDPEKQRKLDEQIHRREMNKKNKKMMKGRQYKVKAM